MAVAHDFDEEKILWPNSFDDWVHLDLEAAVPNHNNAGHIIHPSREISEQHICHDSLTIDRLEESLTHVDHQLASGPVERREIHRLEIFILDTLAQRLVVVLVSRH